MVAETTTFTVRLGPLTNAELARMSNEQLCQDMVTTARAKDALTGREAQVSGEMERRQAFRADGATSIEAWISARCRRSTASARVLAHVGQRLFDLPHLQAALSSGEASFDQLRALVDVADPESDAGWASEVREGRSVRELGELARRAEAEAEAAAEGDEDVRKAPRTGPERASVRFNDTTSTMTARLPKEAYAEMRGRLEGLAKELGNPGSVPYDERLGQALVLLCRRATGTNADPAPYFVVAHVALSTLLDEESTLRAELERDGLISSEVVRRLCCDAMMVVALDDEAGHSMYEGRARRFPTDAQRRELMRRDRRCRFPGCEHVRFLNAHHVTPWKPGGRTDLDNLAILCAHHHHLVHSNGWSMSGNANEVLRFVSPDGRITTSHPSPLWGTLGGAARSP